MNKLFNKLGRWMMGDSDAQWNATIHDIDNLIEVHETGGDFSESYTGITRKHWINAERAVACEACSVRFSTLNRPPKNCYRCGYVFCFNCMKYQRRLNDLANLDPQGTLYPVCKKCFNTGTVETPCFRNRMDDFVFFKSYHRNIVNRIQNDAERPIIKPPESWFCFDFDQECKRLRDGFKHYVGTSSIKKSLHEIRCAVKIPDWQLANSVAEERHSPRCYNCKGDFGILRKKRQHCSVCGIAVCDQCSNSELIVFIPDGLQNVPHIEPRLAIIKIVGCPEEEPELCLYLRVCNTCRATLIQRQVDDYHSMQVSAEKDDAWIEIVNVQNNAAHMQRKIDNHLPKLQDIVESMESSCFAPTKNKDERGSIIQKLAKSQEDLSDYFTQLVMVIHGLKNVKQKTNGQIKLMSNMTKGFVYYYQSHMFQFRVLRKRLESVLPLDTLNMIQSIVEKNAINGCCLTVRQLTYEVINLTMKYGIESNLPSEMALADDVMLEELKKSVTTAGEPWEEHEDAMKQLICLQLKEHKFIKPSRTMTKLHGKEYVLYYIQERSHYCLQMVKLQLSNKCAERSFQPSRDAIQRLHEIVLAALESGNKSSQST